MTLTLTLALALLPQTKPASGTVFRGPVSYFEARCSRCHGTAGSNFNLESLSKRSEKSLRDIIDDMCAGPGGAPLKGGSLDLLVAYHRSLRAGTPFIWVRSQSPNLLSGEVTPNSKLIGRSGKKTFPIIVRDGAWSTIVTKQRPIEALTATLGKATVSLDPRRAKSTHVTKSK